jgi:serine/threonine protein phosphatase PrpC
MASSANGTPLNNNTLAASAAGESSLPPSDFEGIFMQSKKGPILTEDRSICLENGNHSVRAVFDGHGGIQGAAFAHIGCIVTAVFFNSIDWEKTTPTMLKSMIPVLFRRIDDKCLEESHTNMIVNEIQKATNPTCVSYKKIRGGGTTATIVFASFCPLTHRRYVLTAHVGDSNAALVCGDVATQLDAGNHGIDNLLEEKRIESDFLHRRNLAIAMGQNPDSVRRVSLTYSDDTPAFVQRDGNTIPNPDVITNRWTQRRRPCNVNDELSGYAKIDGYSLAMVRAIGDFALRDSGVVALPTVSVIYLNPEQNGRIVVASDGLWDGVFLTREQKLKSRYPHFHCISEMLTLSDSIDTFGRMAFQQICMAFSQDYDDITVVVGNLRSHAEYLAEHLAKVPESHPAHSGVPCNVLHVYDCYDQIDYNRDIEEQFPVPNEVIHPIEEIVLPVLTMADVLGPVVESAKRQRLNQYGKVPRVRIYLHRKCKQYSTNHRVNKPRK